MAPGGAQAEQLVCPRCAASYPAQERFCPRCRMPLVVASETETVQDEQLSERRRQARKVKPQLAEGPLVRVAGARNQAEAEFIQGLLLEEGVPSLLKRSAGFDVPDFLAAGPRDIMVPRAGAETAREVLLQAEVISAEPAGAPVAPMRLLVGLLIALALGALVVWLIATVIH